MEPDLEPEVSVYKPDFVFLFSALVAFFLLYFFISKRRHQRQFVINVIVNLQNFFDRPVINDVHFYQRDQMVPDT